MGGFNYDAIWQRGYLAAQAGEPRSSCPYADKRKKTGAVTWSRAYRNAWLTGWDAYHGRDRYSNQQTTGN